MASLLAVGRDNELLWHGLECAGHEVRRVAGARPALRILQELDPGEIEMVVTPVELPDMDGFELLHEMRTARMEMPSIALVPEGSSGELFANIARKLGAALVIRTPLEPASFVASVAGLLARPPAR